MTCACQAASCPYHLLPTGPAGVR
ncbi:hypothetical protein E2C01_084530 [Portunus trituberculatus]|uniref:Uncharacterized protein n=1 Tax=Portunus trituberculatus TaxID=210409 RepID=A0A5B7J6I9_PORTR|nr:hypothetical protein [Portunus trituberculatus]